MRRGAKSGDLPEELFLGGSSAERARLGPIGTITFRRLGRALYGGPSFEAFVFNRLFILSRLVALGVIFALAGCRQSSTTPAGPAARAGATREFTDGLGRRVTVNTPPQRIVSLAPNLTEMLFALGLDDRIVGVTSYCDFPPAARAKEKVGDTIRPDLEKLITLHSDLVLVSTASQLENLTRRLDQLSIPVYVTDPRTVRAVIATLRAIGEVTGATEPAARLSAEMERRINEVEARVRPLPRPRILYALQTEPLITIGHRTFINDLITLAGGSSISDSESADYPQFSRETVVARAPEVIVAPLLHGTNASSEQVLRRAFAETPAVRAGRIALVDPDLINRPGPRIIDGLEEMARALHPELGVRRDR
jgi:iron complex transport system substrate-binding protein